MVAGFARWASAGEDPLPAERTVTVAAGPEYATNGFNEFWLGEGHRKLWTTPVRVPVLDLERFAGGLEPVGRIGRQQTSGLALRGADGRAYTFRSLRKEPERVLPVAWRESLPARVVRDHTSALHPGAPLLLAPLAETLGVLHTRPRLVVMPDDARLGEFREAFQGHMGTIDSYPQAGFAGATEFLSSRELWERRLADPTQHADARAFLRARLLDLLVENYDRHAGQWRWARLPELSAWRPLPEDPDMAFIRNDGVAFDWLRNRSPKFVRFGPEFDGRLEGSTFSGAELDRWLLVELERADFEAEARATQALLTDAAISASAAALPSEWRALDEARTVAALRRRRDRLVEHALHYYRDLAAQVDVHATDRDDLVSLHRDEAGVLEVQVAEQGASAPYYRRRFVPAETSEVRIYLHGGDDRVVRSGPAGGPILVRVVAGAGTDVVDDAASGGTEAWAGPGELRVQPGSGTRRRDSAPAAAPPNPAAPWSGPRDFGHWTVPYTRVLYASELELLLGAGITRTAWGFRRTPEASRQEASFFWSTGESSGRLAYSGTFRWPGSRGAFKVDALGSGIERTNFFGFGNQTARPESRSGYRTLEKSATLSPSLRFERSERLHFGVGGALRFSDTPTDQDNVLNAAETYGRGSFAEAGVRTGLRYDTRGVEAGLTGREIFEAAAPETTSRADLRAAVEGFFFPGVLDVQSSFGGVEGELAGYLGPAHGRLQLAARVGGRRVWGDYPWFESAFVGGRANLRAYSRQRFAGDASLYASAEARAWLFTVDVPLPIRVGVLALGDVGRVWLSGESSRRWHDSWGGGLMLQPVATPFVFTVAAARGSEDTRVYFGYGYSF